MFEFQWQVPGPTPMRVTLRIHSRSGWLGRKTLTCNEQTVFRRGLFAGVEHRFTPPGGAPPLHLRMVQIPGSADWRPALLAQGAELPEITGTAPPRIVPPPKSLAVPVGITFLAMSIAIVMLPQLATILNAIWQRSDICKTSLVVVEPSDEPAPSTATTQPYPADTNDRLWITTPTLPPATLGEPYEFTLVARGGQPPYAWRALGDHGLPAGLTLDSETGRIHGVPEKVENVAVKLRVIDDSYAASRDIGRWLIPFMVSTVCLLGFLAMRRWSVYLYGILILAQIAGAALPGGPISVTAVCVQGLLWLLGAAHLARMR